MASGITGFVIFVALMVALAAVGRQLLGCGCRWYARW
jgi:hypothetical protein